MYLFRRLLRSKGLPKDEYALLKELEIKIQYHFKDLALLKKALSHKSYVNENKLDEFDHNERLEFLGDAVLELGISCLLMRTFIRSHEGEMSKLRASIVNELALSEIARKLDIGQYMFLGKGEEQCDGREKNSLLADALEAILGAVYQDSNFKTVYKLIQLLFLPIIDRATREDINRDYKTKLQEEVQNQLKISPQYRLVNEIGPDHDKTFEVQLSISNHVVGEGSGKSKKQAEQNAAKDTLDKLEDIIQNININNNGNNQNQTNHQNNGN
jgi:ribonuclease III